MNLNLIRLMKVNYWQQYEASKIYKLIHLCFCFLVEKTNHNETKEISSEKFEPVRRALMEMNGRNCNVENDPREISESNLDSGTTESGSDGSSETSSRGSMERSLEGKMKDNAKNSPESSTGSSSKSSSGSSSESSSGSSSKISMEGSSLQSSDLERNRLRSSSSTSSNSNLGGNAMECSDII